MSKKTIASMAAIVLCVSVLAAAPASAQSAGPSLRDEANPHHLKIYQMMMDMTQEMSKMTEQMSAGALTPEQQKQIAQRMTVMSTMMRRLSGLEARPAMRDGDWQKRMDEMRKQMDGMMRNSQTPPGTR